MISFFSKKRNHQYIKCATTFIAAAIILLSIVTFNQGLLGSPIAYGDEPLTDRTMMVAGSPMRIPFGQGIASPPPPSSIPTAAASTTATCQKLSVSKVTANGDDGNIPANTIDNKLSTRW